MCPFNNGQEIKDLCSLIPPSLPRLPIFNGAHSFSGEGLLVANGARWARSRRLLTPAFHFDTIKSYFPIYADAAKLMVVSIAGTK